MDKPSIHQWKTTTHVKPGKYSQELSQIHTTKYRTYRERKEDYIKFLENEVLQLRAKIAIGQTEEVLAEVAGEENVPDLAAVKALAQQVSGDVLASLKAAEMLAARNPDNATVQVLAGTVLQAQGKSEEALALLAKHQGNLEA